MIVAFNPAREEIADGIRRALQEWLPAASIDVEVDVNGDEPTYEILVVGPEHVPADARGEAAYTALLHTCLAFSRLRFDVRVFPALGGEAA